MVKTPTRPFLPFWRILLNVVDLGTNLNVFFYFAVMFLLFKTPPNRENSSLTTSMYCNFDNMLQKLPPPRSTPILMILRVRTISSTFVWNAANWQAIDFTDDFYLFFPLCRALETGFNFHFCLKLSESNCSSLSCLKTPKNVKNCFNPYSFFYTFDEKGQFRPISP